MIDPAEGVVYEVNLEVDHAIEREYRDWLDAHVHAMLALPGFESAQVFDVREPAAADRVGLCVHYRLRDAGALESYLHEHAPRMRADGEARFGGRFCATRRILHPA